MWEYSLVQHRNLYHPKNITAPDNRMSFRGCSKTGSPALEKCMKSNMQSNTADTACRSFRGRRKRLDSAVTGRKGLPASDAETADMISFLRAAEGWYG